MRRTIRLDGAGWPKQLNDLGPEDPPTELRIQGDDLPERTSCLAIVGTRRASNAGMALAKRFATRFAEADYVVVSGMARGIDTAAHRGALEAGGRTIAVVGCGLDLTYPPRNEGLKRQIAVRGSLVSEYEDRAEPHAFHFPQRNRIIAGLSAGVVVIEGGLKSGALITARIALEAGREVWAVPGHPHDPHAAGPNHLIRAGEARLVTDPDQVFEEIAPEVAWRGPYEIRSRGFVDLSHEETEVLGALGSIPASADQLCTTLALPAGRLALALAKLEVKGLARRSRGGGYEVSEAGGRALSLVLEDSAGAVGDARVPHQPPLPPRP